MMDNSAEKLLLVDDGTIVWSDEVDVVIVGFGAAGACAAIEAAEAGTDVLALDRFQDGGSTASSGGVYYGGGTRFQKEAGFDDNADEMFRYLSMELGNIVAQDTLRRFCEDSSRNLDWLVEHGVPFSSAFTAEKTSLPGAGKYLYFSGDESAPANQAVARPAPRGHKAVGPGASGNVLWAKLNEAAKDRGVRVQDHSPVTRLVVDPSGRVIGVEVNRLPDGTIRVSHQAAWRAAKLRLGLMRSKGAERAAGKLAAIESKSTSRQYVRARNGVILATGGFVYNRPMVRANAPLYDTGVPIGLPGDDGSGIALGVAAGGLTASMDKTCASKSLAPPTELIEGIMVDRHGNRVINEDCYTGKLGRSIAESDGGIAWLILDRQRRNIAVRKSLPGNGRLLLIHCLPALMSLLLGTKRASTVASLARKCGIPADKLVETIDAYNADAGGGREDPLGKRKSYFKQLANGPFYAVNLSARSATSPLSTFTLGGLKVDEDTGAVMRTDGSTVEGLYAVGRAAVGLPSNFYLSGLSIADCVFSGRRAGRSVSTQTPPAKSNSKA